AQCNGADKWLIADGVATVHGASISTKQSFGSCQLHLEWAAPADVKGAGQGRGNSGVYLMSHYEVQILDSYENVTYYDGQAASIYKQWPPLVNACRKPGEWQTYDIIFDAPKFDEQGKLLKPGYVTVLQNGVIVQNHSELQGTTAWDRPAAYEPHADKLPLTIQDHGNPVRFRNIWIRELADRETPRQAPAEAG
ncbi:MAG: 3-keto-disaccharide hydrolase, partial [Pirellulales bacterium]